MARIEYHDTLIRQYQESRVIMIIRLEAGTDKDFFLLLFMKIILHGFYISMSINVADIGSVYTAIFTFIMQGTRIGKPTPGTFIRHLISFIDDRRIFDETYHFTSSQ